MLACAAIAFAVLLVLSASLMRCTASSSSYDDGDSYSEDDGGYESSDYDSDYSDSDDSYDDSDSDYSSSYDNDSYDDYDYLHDEDTGISGVMNDDGEGIFSGDDFAMRRNEDGSSVATDGKGNWIADSDGDGEIDSMSIDGGETWF
ncbi:MAG: hypothetical protein ACLROE_04370 [Collinsella intestinalis]